MDTGILAIYTCQMDISVTRFRQQCLEIIRRVERGGEPVRILRRGKEVARVESALSARSGRHPRPWAVLQAMGGEMSASPGESVARDDDFQALR